MERFEKRFGTIAVELGIITNRQLLVAMNIQIEDDLAGKDHVLLGQILMAGGIISKDQIRAVLTEMGIKPPV
ncbi:MAG: hypothetical protein WC405_00320 [Syntrophales bacterium]